MLKATSAPTLRSPSITALAPNNRRAAVVSLLTYWMPSWPPVAEHRRGEARLHIGRELLLPLGAHHRLDRRRLDRADADDRLDQKLLARRAAIELLVDEIAQRRPDQDANQNVDRQTDQHDQREPHGIGEHDPDEDEGEQPGRSPKTIPARSESRGSSRAPGPARRSAPPNASRNSSSAGAGDGRTVAGRARRRCGWWCATMRRRANTAARHRTGR